MQEQSTQNWRYLVNNFFTCSFLIKCSTKFNKGQFFYGACSPIAGHGLLMLEVFRDHAQRHTTVGRTPVGEWSARHRDLYLTTHNTHNRQTSMPPAGFEPTIPASHWPQTHALDHAATGTGHHFITVMGFSFHKINITISRIKNSIFLVLVV